MKRKNLIWAAAVLLVAVLGCMLWPEAESQGIFYRVSGGKNELYVLGSIHIGSRGMYPFSRSIRNAMQNADVLVFECDTQSAQSQQETALLMRYAADDHLGAHISPEVLQLVEKAAQKMGYDLQALQGMKPWAITSMLSMETLASAMEVRNVDKALSLGVENTVNKQSGQKEVRYLETVSEQLERMDSFSPALQEYLLRDACKAVLSPKADEELKQWPAWWAAGDAQAFADAYRRSQAMEAEPMLAHEYHDSLITQRNRMMAQRLRELMEG